MSTLTKFHQAAERTTQWACTILDKGAFGPARGIIGAHYKAPMALLAAGRTAESSQVLGHLKRHFFRDGNFHYGQDDPTPAPGTNYRNGWIAWGAHCLGCYDIAKVSLDFLETQIHPSRGGVVDIPMADPQQRALDVGATACVVNALLAGGRTDAAVRAAQMLRRVFDQASTAGTHILLREQWDGQRIEATAPDTGLPRSMLCISAEQPGQIYWYLGYAMRVLALLYRATGDKDWLTIGHRVGDFTLRCHDEIYACATNGKLAWGATEMYGVTGDERYLTLATRISDWLIATQDPSGVWVRRPQFDTVQAQPLPVSLDTSVERLFYMYDIPRALELYDTEVLTR